MSLCRVHILQEVAVWSLEMVEEEKEGRGEGEEGGRGGRERGEGEGGRENKGEPVGKEGQREGYILSKP